MDYLSLLSHKYPFLFVDKVISCQPGKNAQGSFKISADNRYLIKICDKEVFPPALLVEAMSQVGAIAILSDEKYRGYRTLLSGIDKTSFNDFVSVGDEVIIKSEILIIKGKFGKRKGEVLVKGRLVASSISTFVLEK